MVVTLSYFATYMNMIILRNVIMNIFRNCNNFVESLKRNRQQFSITNIIILYRNIYYRILLVSYENDCDI